MTPGRRARDLLGPAAMAVAAGALAVTVLAVDPGEPGHYPTCPVLALTGWYCTGCGVLRCVRALVHLDLVGAWAMNPLVVLIAPMLVASWGAWLVRAWTGRPRRWLARRWAVLALLALMAAFTVARNIPVLHPWLGPAG